MRAPFQLDLHVPNFNWPDVPPEQLFDRLADIALTAEESGFSSISLMDHLPPDRGGRAAGELHARGQHGLAGIAARTSRINLGLLVGGVTYRNPALYAKITTTIDVISGGRAVFGIGAAWFEGEHQAYGFDFPPLKERFERLEETLQIARSMFTQERTTFDGQALHASTARTTTRSRSAATSRS